ncbi:hypothetical protein Mal35_20180 [Gimesia maris]|uniref:Hint domain-containing protein n=1 Tax=Gimesia maris TaxID=122 RepID=UPI0011880B21|nr:Hint domain-containing protein [Gimesia maris]QDT78569.1 hypothetical protein Mal35_20180 [Gimesia maris]
MSDISRKLQILSCLLLTSFCFWKAGTGLIGGADAEILPSAQAAMSPAVTPPRVVTTPIQQMRPGMRVVGRNPIRIQTESTVDPTPDGWRLLSVRMRKPDDTYFEAELLRPLSWIRQNNALPGAVIQLEIPEMHVAGEAEVLSIADCPPIRRGPGSVVTGTFQHVSDEVISVFVEGEPEPIGTMSQHPFWSRDRNAFVPAGELRIGEELKTALGTSTRVTSIEIRAGPETVYGLEVAGEHVYQITNAGLLVHNASGRNGSSGTNWKHINRIANEYDDYVNSKFYGGIPTSKPHFKTSIGSRYFDNIVDDGVDIIGIENKYFRQKNGYADTGVVRGTKKRQKLAETLLRIRKQARKDQELLLSPDANTPTRIDWNLNTQYPKLQKWLESLDFNVYVHPRS